MTKFSLLALPLLASGLLLTGCVEEGAVVYDSGPSYYGGGGYYGDPNPDFYYTGRSPYSRQYGVLVFRDGGYYYNRGGAFYLYSRPAWGYNEYYRYRNDNWRNYYSERGHHHHDHDYDHRHHASNKKNNNNRNNNRKNDQVRVRDTRQGTHVSYDTNDRNKKVRMNSEKKSSNRQQANSGSNKKKNQGSGGGGGGNKNNKKKNQDDEKKNKKKKN